MTKIKKLALVFFLIGSFFSLNVKGVLAAERGFVETMEAFQERDGKKCNFLNSCVQAGEDVTVKVSGLSYQNGAPYPDGEKVEIDLDSPNCGNYNSTAEVTNGSATTIIPGNKIKSNCSYKVTIRLRASADSDSDTKRSVKTYTASLPAKAQCGSDEEQCNEDLSSLFNYELCSQQIQEGTDEWEACKTCFEGNGVWTAVGCIPRNPESVITVVVTIGLAAGGGIVLIMILVGSFMLSVSQGDPNKTKEAKEIITSAIIGLLFVIFSVTILQFIGVSILHIPGFGE